MKDDFIYKEGTTPWFIVAGIAFILYMLQYGMATFFPSLIALISEYDYASEVFTTQNLLVLLWNIFSFLVIAAASLLITIGCFTKGKLIRLSGIGFILTGAFLFLTQLVYSLFQILSLAKESLTISMIGPRFFVSKFTSLLGAFFLLLIFLFMGCNCIVRLKHKTANIISGILLILYEIINVCFVLFGRLFSIFSITRYSIGTYSNSIMLSSLISPIIFSVLSAIILIVGCVALFFFAGRIEWLPCFEEEDETFTS